MVRGYPDGNNFTYVRDLRGLGGCGVAKLVSYQTFPELTGVTSRGIQVSTWYKMKYARNPRYERTGLVNLVVQKINADTLNDVFAEYEAASADSRSLVTV